MIIFVDPSTHIVTIADKIVETFHISEIEEFERKILNKKVLWVTNAANASGNDVVDLLKSFLQQSESQSRSKPRTGRMLLHSTVPGQVIVTGPGVSLKFSNPLDFKDMSSLPADIMDICPNLRRAIEIGKIAMIDEADKSIVRNKFNKYLKQSEKREKNKDKVLDSLLINSNVRAADFAATGGSDVDTLDITGDEEIESADEDSEESQFIKRYKIK